MFKTVSRKTFLLLTVLVLMVSVLSISLLSLDNIANAEDPEVQEYETIAPISTGYSYRAQAKNVLVDLTGIPMFITTGVEIIINKTVENITFTYIPNKKISGSKITIESRNADLNIYFDDIIIEGKDNEATIINKSTKGTVHLINNGTKATVIKGGDRTESGSFKDGLGISGIIYTKGNISFEGEYGFVVDGAGNSFLTTYLGNLHYGNTGLQVSGNKNVYVNTTVNVFGGVGLAGAHIGQLGYGGGHGGYAFDGSSSNVIIGDNGYFTLKGGDGGDGACLAKSGILGKGGKAGAAYKGSINVNDTSKFEYEDGEDGIDGFFLGY